MSTLDRTHRTLAIVRVILLVLVSPVVLVAQSRNCEFADQKSRVVVYYASWDYDSFAPLACSSIQFSDSGVLHHPLPNVVFEYGPMFAVALDNDRSSQMLNIVSELESGCENELFNARIRIVKFNIETGESVEIACIGYYNSIIDGVYYCRDNRVYAEIMRILDNKRMLDPDLLETPFYN